MNDESRRARLAVIGTGMLAQNQHIPNLQRCRHAELAVLCDLRADVLAQLAAKYPGARTETDHRRVLADPAIDGVIIATRADTHVTLAREALAAGKHVYVEKPLAEDAAGCAGVLEAQQRSGRILAVGMNRRMAPAYRYAKRLLDAAGGPLNLHYRIADSYSVYDGRPGVHLIHEVCHIFDILRFFVGREVHEVMVVSARPDDESILLSFEGGAVATILSSGYVNSDMPKERMEAVARVGGLTVEEFCEVRQYSLAPGEPPVTTFAGHYHPDHDMTHVFLLKELGFAALQAVRRCSWATLERLETLKREGTADAPEHRTIRDFAARMPLRNYLVDKGWVAALDHFGECCVSGAPFQGATGRDAVIATRIVDAALASRKSGRPVAVESME